MGGIDASQRQPPPHTHLLFDVCYLRSPPNNPAVQLAPRLCGHALVGVVVHRLVSFPKFRVLRVVYAVCSALPVLFLQVLGSVCG